MRDIYISFIHECTDTYTEPKKKLSRDLNGTISTFAFINSFYSYLLLHND